MDLGPVDETNAATWKSVWAQVALQEMPPKKKDQPETIERLQFTDWIVQQLETTMADKRRFPRSPQEPSKANFIDHDLLFGPLPDGIQLEPTSSPKRIWRLTPSEHLTRLNELINTEPEYDSKRPRPPHPRRRRLRQPRRRAQTLLRRRPHHRLGSAAPSPTLPLSKAFPSCSLLARKTRLR